MSEVIIYDLTKNEQFLLKGLESNAISSYNIWKFPANKYDSYTQKRRRKKEEEEEELQRV
jgi:hypothetical protein